VTPNKIDDQGERPDFMLTISARTVGVEVTMYQSCKTIAGVTRRKVEAAWEQFESYSRTFR
jgi:hypothetical protein